MANKQMKTLTIGENTYEIVDQASRTAIESLQENSNNVSTQIGEAIAAIDYPVDSVNGKTGQVTLSANDVNALPLTGGTITGDLTIGNSNNYSYLYLANQNGDNIGGLYASDSANRLYLINHVPNSTAGKYEGYGLPAATTENLTDNKWYNILTSKNAVTVAQGGTGATTARDALVNLGLRVTPYLGSGDYSDIIDLNELTLTGLFQVAGSFTNAPITSPCFILSVCSDNSRYTQFAWRSTSTTAAKTVYMRKYDSSWSDWEAIAGPGLVSGYLPLSGGTLTGPLTVNSEFYVQRSNNYPSVYFNDKDGNMVGMMQFSAANHKGYFVEYATDTSYKETYNLPLVATGLTADKSYSILTSKSPVTVEQGGTGAITPEAARTALGITPDNIGALALSGGTLTGGLNCVLSSNNYYIRYRTSATATTDVASLRFNGASGYRRFAFTQQSAGTGGYTESYVLPRVSNSITANATYDILTTKSYVVCDTTPTTVVDGTWYLVKQG